MEMSFSLLLLLSPNKQLDMIHKTNIWGLLTGGKKDADQPEILGPKKWHGDEFPGLSFGFIYPKSWQSQQPGNAKGWNKQTKCPTKTYSVYVRGEERNSLARQKKSRQELLCANQTPLGKFTHISRGHMGTLDFNPYDVVTKYLKSPPGIIQTGTSILTSWKQDVCTSLQCQWRPCMEPGPPPHWAVMRCPSMRGVHRRLRGHSGLRPPYSITRSPPPHPSDVKGSQVGNRQ